MAMKRSPRLNIDYGPTTAGKCRNMIPGTYLICVYARRTYEYSYVYSYLVQYYYVPLLL